MAKKPRSQRRKKGTCIGSSNSEVKLNGKRSINDNSKDENMETLSDSYTVADSFSVSTALEDDLSADGGMDPEDDLLLMNGNHSSESENAAMAAAARQNKLNEVLGTVEDFPTEKRSAKREGMLRRMFRAITHWATGPMGCELIIHHSEQIRTACFYSLRVGTPAEQYAACRVLEATSVTLGADQDEFVESIQDKLQRIVMTTKSRATPVRMAALRAMAMANFICSSDLHTTEDLLDLCEQIADHEYRGEVVPTTLRAAALDCWALLATTIPDLDLAGQDDIHMGRGLGLLQLLKHCLDTNSVELRSAAGECMSLIHEARLNLGIRSSVPKSSSTDDDPPEKEIIGYNHHDEEDPVNDRDESEQQPTSSTTAAVTTTNTTERRFRRGSWNGSEWEVLMDEVQQRIAELSVESGYKMSKKAKKEQRATFREFMATIVDDESPEEVVNFRGGTLTLSSWREIIQLNFVRHCLQGGFQIQLLTNQTLQTIFGADGSTLNELGTLSQVEKRLILSKTSEASKAADKELTRKRRVRTNIKNHFLTVDGDDI